MNEALPVWTCSFERASEPAPDLKALTVGSPFVMGCKGDIPVSWQKGNLELVFAKKEDMFSLHILKIEKLEAQSAVFLVTGYKAGEFKPDYIRVVQKAAAESALGFEFAKPQWQIQSVLKKDQQAQPFPPFGPWSLGFPLWILIAVGVFLALLLLVLFRGIRRYSQRNRIRTEMARHKTALAPIHQFYRDSRQWRRRLNEIKTDEERKSLASALNHDFRLFILREFQIPTLEWSDRAIVEDLRRRHRHIYDQAGDSIRKTLRELGRLSTRPQVMQNDLEQVLRMSLDAVERTELAKDQRRGKR